MTPIWEIVIGVLVIVVAIVVAHFGVRHDEKVIYNRPPEGHRHGGATRTIQDSMERNADAEASSGCWRGCFRIPVIIIGLCLIVHGVCRMLIV